MQRTYTEYTEYGNYAEAYKDGKQIAQFTYWDVGADTVNRQLQSPIAAILTAKQVVPLESFRTRCDLVLYKTETDCPERPWRKYTGDLWHDREAKDELQYYFDIKSEHEV